MKNVSFNRRAAQGLGQVLSSERGVVNLALQDRLLLERFIVGKLSESELPDCSITPSSSPITACSRPRSCSLRIRCKDNNSPSKQPQCQLLIVVIQCLIIYIISTSTVAIGRNFPLTNKLLPRGSPSAQACVGFLWNDCPQTTLTTRIQAVVTYRDRSKWSYGPH